MSNFKKILGELHENKKNSYQDLLDIMAGKKIIHSDIMFHFTKTNNLNSIISTGLNPIKGKVYLHSKERIDDENDIEDWVNEKFNRKKDNPKISLLEIDTKNIDIYLAVGEEYYSKTKIEPSRIKIITNDFIY